jgi:hypothetical protein
VFLQDPIPVRISLALYRLPHTGPNWPCKPSKTADVVDRPNPLSEALGHLSDLAKSRSLQGCIPPKNASRIDQETQKAYASV